MRASLIQVGQTYEATVGANPAVPVVVTSRAGTSLTVQLPSGVKLQRTAAQLRPRGAAKLHGMAWLREHATPGSEAHRAVAEYDAQSFALDVARGQLAQVRAAVFGPLGSTDRLTAIKDALK